MIEINKTWIHATYRINKALNQIFKAFCASWGVMITARKVLFQEKLMNKARHATIHDALVSTR